MWTFSIIPLYYIIIIEFNNKMSPISFI
uniref:Uncharacterized protein n=1 Tax=Anguilla anguilla TaxID=7936 RepID=A0A0E9RVV1_ANGAN